MICLTERTYTTCANYSAIPTYGPVQSCAAGLICRPSRGVIYCINLPGPLCTMGHQICLSSVNYTTCTNYVGEFVYAPAQSCQDGTTCHMIGSSVYCIPLPSSTNVSSPTSTSVTMNLSFPSPTLTFPTTNSSAPSVKSSPTTNSSPSATFSPTTNSSPSPTASPTNSPTSSPTNMSFPSPTSTFPTTNSSFPSPTSTYPAFPSPTSPTVTSLTTNSSSPSPTATQSSSPSTSMSFTQILTLVPLKTPTPTIPTSISNTTPTTTPTATCTIGHGICTTMTSFSMCEVRNGLPAYGSSQTCSTGLVCEIDGSSVFCVRPYGVSCISGNQICISSDTYATCSTYTGILAFGPTQSCPQGLTCRSMEAFIFCS
eukprot:TRINITY_DN3452_c0_g1_i3.p1 TRINITY_DN3452_c0_g1~~TRINITY_DN3452_c0_g1_i3.p1  ORF type:complete len:370 (+),score=30.16 TRINITY_DN3452_c0_g1_i3:187-1296(+)